MDRLIDLLDTRVTQDEASLSGVVALFVFTLLLVASHLRLDARVLSYLFRDLPVPDIAKRDWWFLTGLSLPFVGIFFVRAFGIKDLGTNLWWLLLTTGCAIGAMLVWAYYEFRVIEREDA